MIEKAISGLIIISGMFLYKMPDIERFFPAQMIYFIFIAGMAWSYILYKQNKWFGLMGILCSVTYLRSILFGFAPELEIYKFIVFAIGISVVYYFTKTMKVKESALKWFIIPALANSIIVIIQFFDHYKMSFLPVAGVTGLLGNKSFVGYYLAMTFPLFLKHFKRGLFLVVPAMIICNGFFGLFASVVSFVIWVYFNHSKFFRVILALSITVPMLLFAIKSDRVIAPAKFRLCMMLGTLDGIKHNPVLGWGIGSYNAVMSRVKPGDISFFGQNFNSEYLVNHPHNELIFGWWSLGILFPVFFIAMVWDALKRFSRDRLTLFLILLSGFICMMGSFLTGPLWLLMIMTFGIYETQKEEICL